jgi:hypothetical protein
MWFWAVVWAVRLEQDGRPSRMTLNLGLSQGQRELEL